MTNREIIELLGGAQRVAEAVGSKTMTVYKWGDAGRHIPARLWLRIVNMPEAQKAGLTMEALEAAWNTRP